MLYDGTTCTCAHPFALRLMHRHGCGPEELQHDHQEGQQQVSPQDSCSWRVYVLRFAIVTIIFLIVIATC